MGSAFELLNSDAVHIREQAKINAARIVQKGRNERAAAESDLARWSQSLSNQRRMKAAGEQVNDITANIGRNLDAALTGTFQSRLRASEELGANAAAAAAAGVGGSTVEGYDRALKLNAAIQEEQVQRGLRTDLLSSSAARGNTIMSAVEGSDFSANMANLDYSQYVDHVKVSGFEKLVAVAGSAAATYFGGPQAGSAVLDLVSANNRAANGDFDGASARMASAFTSGMTGVKAYTDGAGPGNRYGTPVMRDMWNSTKRALSGVNLRI